MAVFHGTETLRRALQQELDKALGNGQGDIVAIRPSGKRVKSSPTSWNGQEYSILISESNAYVADVLMIDRSGESLISALGSAEIATHQGQKIEVRLPQIEVYDD